MHSINRDYSFSAAHRLEGHPKCGRLHGHNYHVSVEVTAPTLTGGMVIDFADLDSIVKPIIDRLDHRYLVSEDNLRHNDPYYLAARDERPDDLVFPEILQSTAEELAKWFAIELYSPLEILGLEVARVTILETDRNAATFTNEVVL